MRKLILCVSILSVVSIPSAFAASGPSSALTRHTTMTRAGGSASKGLQREARRKVRTAQRHARRTTERRQGAAVPPQLQAIAACGSGGNPAAIGGGGAYRGKYQFDQGTWASVGGSGDPAAAPEAEQDKRAAMLYARSGASSWPVCGS